MITAIVLIALLLTVTFALGRWMQRAARRYGEGRTAALRRQGWERVTTQHCRTIGRDRYDTCPLVVIETRQRWQRVRSAVDPLPAARPAREPRPLPSQRPRVR